MRGDVEGTGDHLSKTEYSVEKLLRDRCIELEKVIKQKDGEILNLLSSIGRMTEVVKNYKSINGYVEEVHSTAVGKGWWETERNFPECLMLMVSEISEALEAYRIDGINRPTVFNEPGKPEGVAVELVDCVIRIMDLFGHYEWDFESILKIKMSYNESRPYRHGGKKC